MKKLKTLCIALGIIVFPFISYGNIEISKTELESQTTQGNILSDSFSTGNECTTIKDRYNKDFPSYKRSDCFSYSGKYYYFICDLTNSCSIAGTSSQAVNSTSSTTTTNTTVPYKEKLDAFLIKVSNMRTDLNNDTKYENLLKSLEQQLSLLSEKYRSNTTISQMITYLSSGVKNLQSQFSGEIDVDTFLCQLLGNCGVTNTCPEISAPLCQNGMPISKGTYIDNDGCERIKYECSSLSTSSSSSSGGGSSTSSSGGGSSSTSSSSSSGGGSSCTGTLPPSGVGVLVRPYSPFVAGPGTNNTVWRYDTGGTCTWGCKVGYTVNASKTNCEPKSAGSGITIYIYDNATQQPMSGVGVDIIGVIGTSASIIASYTTDSNGKTPENFDPPSSMGNILQIKQTGYSIANASGCSPRVTSGNIYCDSIKMENSVVKIYLQNGATSNPTTKIGNSMNNLSNSACVNQTWYAVVEGVSKSNPPKGCARLAGTNACTNPADFRDYTENEWSGNNRIVTSGQANQFPVATYEFFALYGNQIVPAGSASLTNCGGGTTGTPTTKIGNSTNNLGSTACANQAWYAVVDGVNKSNPPKGCARLAGTNACTNPADFRDYTENEWSGNNRIVTSGQANQFPVATYEFFAAYGNQIVSAGSATLLSCSSNTPTPNSCKWQYHSVVGPVGPTDIDPNTTACSSSLNGRSAYEIGDRGQKVATCKCD